MIHSRSGRCVRGHTVVAVIVFLRPTRGQSDTRDSTGTDADCLEPELHQRCHMRRVPCKFTTDGHGLAEHLSGGRDRFEEIPEEQPTLEGNASQKSFFVFNKFNHNCFADDTGLEIEALKGDPGVYSARYAGNDKDAGANMDKVLSKLSKINFLLKAFAVQLFCSRALISRSIMSQYSLKK